MFCKQCGTENAEGALFCKNCGTNLSVPMQQVSQAYVAPVPPVKAARSSNPVLNVVKNIIASPLFLVAAITYSLQILVSVINSAKAGTLIRIFLYNMINQSGGDVPYAVYEIIDKINMIGNAPFVVVTIISLIPAILICAGLWMAYSSAASRASDAMKTSGLTMIKVITILQLISQCILLAFVDFILLTITTVGAVSGEYMAGAIVAVCVIAIIFVTAIFVLNIVYYAKSIKSINTVKGTIATGIPSSRVSGFVGVWTFIIAGFLIFSLGTNFLVSALSMTSLICFGILIFKYKNKMNGLLYENQRNTNTFIAQ